MRRISMHPGRRSSVGVVGRLLAAGALLVALASCGDDDDTSGDDTSGGAESADASNPFGPPTTPPDAVELSEGEFETPEGEIFVAPEEFSIEDCEDGMWPTPEDTAFLAEDADVPVDPVEWLTFHVHAQLTVFVDGEPEVVPAGIGIDNEFHHMASLHTHDCTGEVHIEAREEAQFTLGQFFAEWDVRLDGECLDDLCEPDTTVDVYLNGQVVDDPATVTLGDCDAISVVAGDAPETIPVDGPRSCPA